MTRHESIAAFKCRYAGYSLPVDIIRTQLYQILKNSEFWDGKVWRRHVINATEQTIELRALMSAAGSSEAWKLRAEILEPGS